MDLNPIIDSSRNASLVVVKYPACVSLWPCVGVRRSGVIGTLLSGGMVQAELNARRR
jgi:hypothetical protein